MKKTIGPVEFAKRCIPGFLATLGALALFGFVFLFVDRCHNDDDKFTKQRNTMNLENWNGQKSVVDTHNQVVSAFNSIEATPPCAEPKTKFCYIQLVVTLAREQRTEKRIQAYCEYLGTDKLPDETPLFVWRALSDDTLSLAERFNMFSRDDSVWPNVDAMVLGWFAGTKLELMDLSVQPTPEPLTIPDWRAWKIFALVLASLVMVVMMVGYFFLVDVGNRCKKPDDEIGYWAIPTNVGSWLIVLIYAPAFLVPWVVFLPLYYFGLALKWLFTGADMSVLVQKITSRKSKRQE